MEYWQIKKRAFDVWDCEEGKMFFHGTAKQVSEKLGIAEKTVYTYGARVKHDDFIIKHKYRLIPTNEFVTVNGKPKKEKKVKKKEKDPTGFAYLKMMLYDRRLSNTVCSFDPVPFLPDLYDLGINCRVYERHNKDIKGVNPNYYLVEVV